MNDLSLHPLGVTRKQPESDCSAGAGRGAGGFRHIWWSHARRIGPLGGGHAVRAVAVFHRVPEGRRPVRLLDRAVSGRLDQPECADQARRVGHGGVVDLVRPPALRPPAPPDHQPPPCRCALGRARLPQPGRLPPRPTANCGAVAPHPTLVPDPLARPVQIPQRPPATAARPAAGADLSQNAQPATLCAPHRPRKCDG